MSDYPRTERVKVKIGEYLDDACEAIKHTNGPNTVAAAIVALAGIVSLGVIEIAWRNDRSER